LARHPQQRIWPLGALAGFVFRQLHHVRPAEQPIHAHVETVCDLADAVKIESAQSCELKIESAPAAEPDASVKGIVCHATNAAGFGEPITKEAEVSRHPAKMETSASVTTVNLVRMPRADQRLVLGPPPAEFSARDEMSDEDAYMALALCNAQGELSTLERAVHALTEQQHGRA
jgi:hypothetical protein